MYNRAAGIVTGKWLIFSQSGTGYLWSKIVEAMADKEGALRGTAVCTAKVSTMPSEKDNVRDPLSYQNMHSALV